MTDDQQWFAEFRETDAYRKFQLRPIAYFCAEFALTDKLPIFAGGLGVLAGDVVREAGDQHLPMVGVGLLYGNSFKQKIREFGSSVVTTVSGNPVTVRVPIQDRVVQVQAYRWDVGTVPLYFLTTDVEGNDPRDRLIVDQLYTEDKERRFQQEMILGVGGLRFLEALGVHPMIYHLNEGHSAMLALEIIQHEIRERMLSFPDALNLAREHIVFTNHTLLAAGNDVFSNDLVAANLSGYAQELLIPVETIVQLGLVQESSLFSMTMLSLRLAGRVNAVSILHGKKAASIWADHPMEGITNGVHVGTWDRCSSQLIADGVQQLSQSHLQSKRQLLAYIQQTTGKAWDDNCLLLGWARRIVSYKRPTAIFADPEKLLSICQKKDQSIRIVISGNVQPGDKEGKGMFSSMQHLFNGRLKDIAVYLPKYNLSLAGLMTAGCDLWLNTPVVGFEACGTSGMKAALNGVLPFSTKDGWMDEVETFGLGWSLNNDDISTNLYWLLEHDIAPMFFTKKEEWKRIMSNARQLILDRYSATRMMREYVEKLYMPGMRS